MTRALGHRQGSASRITVASLLAASAVLLCSCRATRGPLSGIMAARSPEAGAAVAADESAPSQVPQRITLSDEQGVRAASLAGGSNQNRQVVTDARSDAVVETRAAPLPVDPTSAATGDSLAARPKHKSKGGKQGGPPDPLPLAAAPALSILQPQRYPIDLRRPIPEDEHLFDGGDKDVRAAVAADWAVRGLDLEDTIGHFDTIDGRTVVVPSNRVALYAPRFAAVRKVSGAAMHERHLRVAAYEREVAPQRVDDIREPGAVSQRVQPIGQIGARPAAALEESLKGIELAGDEGLLSFRNHFAPYEDIQIVRRGVFEQSEKARLAESIEAAIAWTGDQMAQAVVDGKNVAIVATAERPESTYQNKRPPGVPQMRVIKLASRSTARPGETVEFTLRFDNMGDELIGNVTIVDNLTPRLAYVDGTAECNLKHEFFTRENEGDSLVLRWEISDPLKVGEGGIVRFQCRVR